MVDPNLWTISILFRRGQEKNKYLCCPAARFRIKSSFGKSGELNFTSSVGGDILLMVVRFWLKSSSECLIIDKKAWKNSIVQALMRDTKTMLLYNPEPSRWGNRISGRMEAQLYHQRKAVLYSILHFIAWKKKVNMQNNPPFLMVRPANLFNPETAESNFTNKRRAKASVIREFGKKPNLMDLWPFWEIRAWMLLSLRITDEPAKTDRFSPITVQYSLWRENSILYPMYFAQSSDWRGRKGSDWRVDAPSILELAEIVDLSFSRRHGSISEGNKEHGDGS